MPSIEINGAALHYEDSQRGDETIFFAHGLLFNLDIFRSQIDYFKDKYRCVAFDFRGQGRSEIMLKGYDMDSLTEDAVGLIEKLDCGPCHFVGLSMGGFVGLRVAFKYPEILKSLTLIDTSSDEESSKFKYKLLNILASWFGLKSVINKVTPIMFSDSFLNDPQKRETLELWKRVVINNHPVGVNRSVNGVIKRDSITDKIHQIEMPTLIMVGEHDVATIPSKSEKMNSLIKGSQLEIIRGVGHMSVIEDPDSVTELMEKFLHSILETPAK